MSLIKSYQKLVQDTLLFIQQEEIAWTFGSNSEAAFFQKEMEQARKKKQEKRLFQKPLSKALPPKKTVPPENILEGRKETQTPPITLKDPVTYSKEPPLPKEVMEPPSHVTSQKIKNDPLEPPKKAPTFHERCKIDPLPLGDIQKAMQKVAPDIPYLSQPPSDARAKQTAQKWKFQTQAAPITILSVKETSQEKIFLENISKAIDLYHYPSRVVPAGPLEKEDGWETFLGAKGLKMIIVIDYSIFDFPLLMKHYKEYPSQNQTLLGDIPCFMLPDLALYFKDPLLKPSLWKAITQKISSL